MFPIDYKCGNSNALLNLILVGEIPKLDEIVSARTLRSGQELFLIIQPETAQSLNDQSFGHIMGMTQVFLSFLFEDLGVSYPLLLIDKAPPLQKIEQKDCIAVPLSRKEIEESLHSPSRFFDLILKRGASSFSEHLTKELTTEISSVFENADFYSVLIKYLRYKVD